MFVNNMGVIAFFFYYYDELYYIDDVQQAFKNVCLDKMLSDGYFDMSVYIFGRIKKEEMYAQLIAQKSKYAVLYKDSYPKKENAFSVWKSKIDNSQDSYIGEENHIELSSCESIAIVNWVYRTMSNSKEREEFTLELFKNVKELHGIQARIEFSQGVAYNSAKVEVHFLSSVSSINKFVSSIVNANNEALFFRGHPDPNYRLKPSIMRSPKLYRNESKLYNELLIECPDDFEKCHSHLEKLVKMQHYGLPTRLLDITRNPLVALYFACVSHKETYGEIVLISCGRNEIKYPQSDTVSIISSFPAFSYEKQQEYRRLAEDPSITDKDFNRLATRLVHEVSFEKPAFRAEINKTDVLQNYIVYALKNNSRIIKQDGAFILCGLSADNGSLEQFRYRSHGKTVIVLISQKESILKELDSFSINRATLFPEIECVSEYLKEKYSH